MNRRLSLANLNCTLFQSYRLVWAKRGVSVRKLMCVYPAIRFVRTKHTALYNEIGLNCEARLNALLHTRINEYVCASHA